MVGPAGDKAARREKLVRPESFDLTVLDCTRAVKNLTDLACAALQSSLLQRRYAGELGINRALQPIKLVYSIAVSPLRPWSSVWSSISVSHERSTPREPGLRAIGPVLAEAVGSMAYRDAGKDYFQTSESIATSERKLAKSRNTLGKPIKLQSKLLALCVDPADARAVYVAEAAGNIKRIVLETGEKTQILHANAPLTSIALFGSKVFAGCWDKQIHVVDLSTGIETRLAGHSDFVKCLTIATVANTPFLISGGADAQIIVWDLSDLSIRYRLKTQKAVQDLVYTDFLYSAASEPDIRRWELKLDGGSELDPILMHETTVWRLQVADDLWTASADRTAKRFIDGKVDTVLEHPDYVKDVVVVEDLGIVITACRDENVRVWDVTGQLLCTYSGHFEEVTCLTVIGKVVISASIDGTIRQWSLDRKEMAAYKPVEVEEPQNLLTTAEEDAELEALMEDD